MSDGEGYGIYLNHSDYYAEGERVIGHWHGQGAAALGLEGEVAEAQFEAVRQARHPETNEFLRPRHSADRVNSYGDTSCRGRHLYDFTISAPKSVSVMASVGDDNRLIDAHRRAVMEALEELESSAGTRVRLDGANENRVTGNLVLAVYHHDTSRELDPQLHTHAVAANLTFDGTEGRWKALQASDIYEQRAYLTEVYRNALAREVRALGYEIADRRDAKGRDAGFEIGGVSNDLLRRYSQRSTQRDEAIEAFKERTGRRPTDNEVAALVRESRADKLLEISTAEVRERQLARLQTEEHRQLSELKSHALGVERIAPELELDSANSSLAYAESHVFERSSVAKTHEVLSEGLRHGRGHLALDALKSELHLEESSGAIVRAGHSMTTRAALERERSMIASIDRGIGAFERLGGERPYSPSEQLNQEQRHAVEVLLSSRDRAVNLRGAAGTGKTAILEALRHGLVENGHEPLAAAPTMSAVNELRKVGFSDAMTIQGLLADSERQATLAGRVLIVDEAGMVSGQQMADLLTLTERQSMRLVFAGDTQQLRSVEAGDALRVLER
ncbi:MAG TPA: MobF family relaxase, partial [Vicinamibacterales bacterium]|nr:MobF family relaxase [Vicinamibacterales bacterium]